MPVEIKCTTEKSAGFNSDRHTWQTASQGARSIIRGTKIMIDTERTSSNTRHMSGQEYKQGKRGKRKQDKDNCGCRFELQNVSCTSFKRRVGKMGKRSLRDQERCIVDALRVLKRYATADFVPANGQRLRVRVGEGEKRRGNCFEKVARKERQEDVCIATSFSPLCHGIILNN